MTEMDTKWHEETKWDMYSDIAETMAEEHTCEDLIDTLVDVGSEFFQYAIRKGNPSGGTLYKHGDMMDLAKYYYKTIIFMMAFSEKMKKHKTLFDMIEKSELECYYDEYVKEKK